jgi:Fic family protein
MVYIVTKKVRGKTYRYVAKSIRLPDGSVKQISKIIKGNKKTSDLSGYFESKEVEKNVEFALSKFKTDGVFTQSQISNAERMRLKYKGLLRSLSKADIADMFDRFTVNFTYDSNAIEGNSLTLKDVQIVMFENAVIRGKDLREIYETKNSRTVVDLVLKRKFDISHKSIIGMHKMLMRDIDDRFGYKKIPNFLVGRTVETSPPERVWEDMERLIGFYQNSKGRIHPLELAAIFHGEFEKIHPFSDGNGRVGRFLINVMLVRSGYPPLIIRKTSRRSYLDALEKFDGGYDAKLKRFLLERYKETFRKFFEVYVRYAKSK